MLVRKPMNIEKQYLRIQRIKTVLVYASAPISKVIGEFEIDRIHHETIVNLWDLTFEGAGISQSYFNEYFDGKTSGYAIKIKSFKAYINHICIKEDLGLHPPQSFAYLQ